MNNIKISIIIPHYNRRDLLMRCLASIAVNDYSQENYEVIVVDDCSSKDIDGIPEYSKIKNYSFHRLSVNSGAAPIPRNLGINFAIGKYVLFVDSDDTISRGFLSKMISMAEKSDLDVVIGKKVSDRASAMLFKSFTEDVSKIDVRESKGGDEFLLIDNYITGRLIRTELLRKFGIKFPDSLKYAEDTVFAKWVYAVSNTFGICSSEHYVVNDFDSELGSTLMTYDNAVDHASFICSNILIIPNTYVPITRKANILNAILKYPYIQKLFKSPYHTRLLKERCEKYLELLKDEPEIEEVVKPFINRILSFNVKPEEGIDEIKSSEKDSWDEDILNIMKIEENILDVTNTAFIDKIVDLSKSNKNKFLSKTKVESVIDISEEQNWIKVDDSRGYSGLTIGGDTYFGEWHTRKRYSQNKTDALLEHGYSYSFEKLAPLLSEMDYNILNFEAVLTEDVDGVSSPINEHQQPILDAGPTDTINEFKNRNINAVLLGNDHSMDFGGEVALESGKFFRANGIQTVGLGSSIDEANKPIFLECGGRKVLIFSAYWFKYSRQKRSNHYATKENAGTSCLDDIFFNKITAYKNTYPDAFIILSPHWGEDFTGPTPIMRELATRAISAGVDCILGHGSRIISEYEWINGKFVIYSIGNFVFNGDDDSFISKGHPTLGYVAKLFINSLSVKLRLYPIFQSNMRTFWQPNFLDNEQFKSYLNYCCIAQEVIKQDELGRYISLELDLSFYDLAYTKTF